MPAVSDQSVYRTGGEWRTELWHEAQDLLRQIETLLHTNRNNGRTGVFVDVREALDDDLGAPEVLCAIRRHVRANGSAADLRAALNLIGIELS